MDTVSDKTPYRSSQAAAAVEEAGMAQMATSDSFTLSPQATIDEVVRTLRQFGVVVMPGYAVGKELETLQAEFTRLFAADHHGVESLDYSPGRARRITRAELDPDRFPAIAWLFAGADQRAILDDYCGRASHLNPIVFATHDTAGTVPTADLHFDKAFGFKFYLYLSDASPAAGALEYVPGSHRDGRARIAQLLREGVRIVDVPNRVPEAAADAVTVGGPAGTVVLFDTAGLHRGGTVERGFERRVLRGHCHGDPAPTYSPVPDTPQWWLEQRPGSDGARSALDAFVLSLARPFALA